MQSRSKSFLTTIAILLILGSSPAIAGGDPSQDPKGWSQDQKDVWALEVQYWELTAKGDAEAFEIFMKLWHPDFAGWPMAREAPVDRAGLEELYTRFFNGDFRFASYEYEPEAVIVTGDVAMVYVAQNVIVKDRQGGRFGGLGRYTHTWVRQGDTWQILGGMSVDLSHKNPPE